MENQHSNPHTWPRWRLWAFTRMGVHWCTTACRGRCRDAQLKAMSDPLRISLALTVTQPKIEGSFEEGIQLFNRANFFEAHEVWEQAWKRADREEKIFYQGLIQAAAALHHIQRGNYRGAISVYLKCRPKLDQFPAVWMGIE